MKDSATLTKGVHLDLYRTFSNKAFQIYVFSQKYSDFSLNSVSKGLLGEQKMDYGVEIDNMTYYQIAKYCDTIVPDGAGGMEPRFTLNTVISSREDAYKVINDMASVFRGILYYACGQVYAIQDSEKLPIYTFTNANVKEGNFT